MPEDKEKTKGWPPEPRTEAMENAPESAEVEVSSGKETGEHKTKETMDEAEQGGGPTYT